MCAALGDVSDAAAAAGPRLNGKPEDKINGLFGSDPLVTFCGWHVQAKKKILMQRRTYWGDFLGHYFCVSLSLFIITFFVFKNYILSLVLHYRSNFSLGFFGFVVEREQHSSNI